MSVLSQPELYVRAKLYEIERERAVAQRPQASEASEMNAGTRRRSTPPRQRLGLLVIRLGTWIAGVAGPAPAPRVAHHQPGG